MKPALPIPRTGRRRRSSARLAPVPAFVPVALSAPLPPAELVLELGTLARVRLTDEPQLALAARLLHHLYATLPC